MKYCILLPFLALFFVGCQATSIIQLNDISQPELLNVGPGKTALPQSAKSLKIVKGVWLEAEHTQEGYYTTTTYQTQKNSVEANIYNALKENPNRCIVNVNVDLTNYLTFSGYRNEADFEGEAFEVQSGNTK